MNYSEFYSRISRPFRRNSRLHEMLIYFNMYFTYTVYLLYPCLLIWLAFHSLKRCLLTVLIPGISFFLLTYVRKKINRLRPYEAWDIDVLLEKQTSGNSMPSRHVFSAAIIAMAVMQVSVPLGYVLLFLTAVSCAVRVLLGVHYPSDVAIGYIVGILCGLPLVLMQGI